MAQAEVVIIGAGIIGCAVAYEAAKRGMTVTVLEAKESGAGASGVGGGFISLATKQPGPHLNLACSSARRYETLSEELEVAPESLGYRKSGSLLIAEAEKDLPSLLEFATGREALGLTVQRLSAEGLRAEEPSLSPHIPGALLFPGDAEVVPISVLGAYLQAARRLGVRFIDETPVTAAKPSEPGWTLKTPKENWSASKVVLAAGAWSGELGKRLFGLDIGVKPRRGQAHLIPLPDRWLRHPVLSFGYFDAKHSNEGDASVRLSLWQCPDGVLFLGGTREWAGFDETPGPSLLQEIRRQGEAVLPALRGAPEGNSILGFRPYSETGLPLIGPVPGLPGLYMATGHEGDGICLAPITGRLVGQALAGETPDIELSAFTPASTPLRS